MAETSWNLMVKNGIDIDSICYGKMVSGMFKENLCDKAMYYLELSVEKGLYVKKEIA